jgi:Tol biopolymer transport system component
LKSGKFEPFLGGISADNVSFSKDGQWVAYVSYPEGTVWRSRLDGTDKLQLTYPAAPRSYAFNPRWSPDGKNIVFGQVYGDKPSRMYEVSSDGGSPQSLVSEETESVGDPNWSPDGNKVVFSGNGNNPASVIRILDLTTHQLSTLPGSQGMFSSRWSPDGRYIASVSADMKRLLLFDFQTQKWKEIANGKLLGWPSFSEDGQYLQFLDTAGTGAVLRLRLNDHKIERVVDLRNFVYTGYYGTWLAIAPDNSPLLLRDTGTSDVYSLDWEEP